MCERMAAWSRLSFSSLLLASWRGEKGQKPCLTGELNRLALGVLP